MRTMFALFALSLTLVAAQVASATTINVPTSVCTAAGATIVFDGLTGATNYVEDHPGSHLGACVVAPKPTPPVVNLPNPPARVELCSPTPMHRADGTTGIYQDWLFSLWSTPTDPSHAWPLAVYVQGTGLFCPDSFNLAGKTDTGKLFEGLYRIYA